ncbi:MAG: signal recognition particle-docking protein FtsY [Synergistaceae bacterium]|nr:signal recognition particle-docking protein FtsY [Synergistaceae bacterium]MBQ3449480.1 signal recognition particle-docking protein FtsY [Synergistaceae bacterium]MBQ3693868.1 signal recognition particle-docking protein FtsY [Synergistaceae bacterium]MBR0250920.1 signal recognition particle-docking protein FtsY [Synergistaceae bacterium]
MSIFSKLRESLKGVREKWSSGIAKLFSGKKIDPNFWDELEEKLITGDAGLDFTEEIIDFLKKEAKAKSITDSSELKKIFVAKIAGELNSVSGMGKSFNLSKTPLVLLMAGVNGSGKTTSAGKLAMMFKRQGKKVIMAASDTFRAAAVEQLKIWGERSDVRVIAQGQGSDPAAVAFDAWKAAESSHSDVLIVDTAGRLHDKHNLMEELRKIHRVLLRGAGEERLETVLVVDAVLGQNSVAQAETFNKIIPVNSIILTKYDNTSKGGVVISIARSLNVPVRYIGLGEGPDDLNNFDAEEFAEALMGSEDE